MLKRVQKCTRRVSGSVLCTKCKICDQVRSHSSLVNNINTLTLDREREQPESPPINITWHTSTNKKHTMLNHWTDSQSRIKEEPDHRINLEAWRSKIFQVSLIAAVEALPRNSLPLQHMRLHPLYQEGQCQWSGCQAVCHNLWDFLHHLQNDHKVSRLFTNIRYLHFIQILV